MPQQDEQSDIKFTQPIVFIRHAQSEGQVNPQLYSTKGDKALELTALGREQARQVGVKLNQTFNKARWAPPEIHYALSRRTLQTASAIQSTLHGGTLHGDTRLDKQEFGLFDGLLTSAQRKEKFPELYEDFKKQASETDEMNIKTPEGESLNDVIERVRSFLRDASHTNKPLIVVTHGLQMLCAEKIITGKSDQWLLDNQDSIQNTQAHLLDPDEDNVYSLIYP